MEEMVCTGFVPSATSSIVGNCDWREKALGLESEEHRSWVLTLLLITSYVFPKPQLQNGRKPGHLGIYFMN